MKTRATPLPVDEELLTVAEVAAEYRVHEETVRGWVRKGAIQGVLVGGFRVKLRRSDIAKARSPKTPEEARNLMKELKEELSHVDTHTEIQGTAQAHADRDASGLDATGHPLPVTNHPTASLGKRKGHRNRW